MKEQLSEHARLEQEPSTPERDAKLHDVRRGLVCLTFAVESHNAIRDLKALVLRQEIELRGGLVTDPKCYPTKEQAEEGATSSELISKIQRERAAAGREDPSLGCEFAEKDQHKCEHSQVKRRAASSKRPWYGCERPSRLNATTPQPDP